MGVESVHGVVVVHRRCIRKNRARRWRSAAGSKPQKVEGDQRGLRSAALGQERMEVAPPIVLERHRLAVDEGAVAGEAANRRGDSRESVGEVRAATALDLDALALLPGEDR